jgi:hypothetical protein
VIDPGKWKWFGYAGHLCVAAECRFHLFTQVGDHLISTVGAGHPGGGERKTIGSGPGDYFETYVFEAGPPCSADGCDCGGMPTLASLIELDGVRARTAADAQANHLRQSWRYAELDGAPR